MGYCFSLTRFCLLIWNAQEYFGEEKIESKLVIDLGLMTDEDIGDGSNIVGETILFNAPENEQSLDI